MPEDRIIESAAGDIHMPGKANNNIPLDSTFEFVPNNPFTVDGTPKGEQHGIAHPGFPMGTDAPGFVETAVAEGKKWSSVSDLAHATEASIYRHGQVNSAASHLVPESVIESQFGFKPTPAGWTPKEEIEKLTNIDPTYVPHLLDSRSPQDFQYRLNSIYQQQDDDRTLENGSTFAKIVGGLVGLSPIGSIENFIPLTALATKAKVSSSFFNAMWRSAPSMTAAAAIREGAKEMSKTDGNLGDFFKDTFIDAAFGTVFFGALKAGGTLLNAAEFSRIKDFAKKYMDGVGFEYVVDKEGTLKGFKAIDTDGSAGAAKVSYAQDIADSAFYKGGIFKIPYVGAATLKVVSGNLPGMEYLTGSPLVSLLNSSYKNAADFADRAFDHFITTLGVAKGGVKADSFESKVKRTMAELTSLHVQTTALHAERNGYAIKARPAIGIQNAFNAARQKTLMSLSQDSQKTDYVSKTDFMDEIQKVLYTGETSEHAAVNQAASIHRELIDRTYKEFREAHNLPEEWLPPRTAASYLMRVYDTEYMNANEGQWMNVVSNWLKDSDQLIEQHLEPINTLKKQISDFQAQHTEAVRELGQKSEAAAGSQEVVPVTTEARRPMKTYTAEQLKALENKTQQIGVGQEVRNDAALSLSQMKAKLKSMEEQLQDRLRSDSDLFIHVDDPNAFSATEAKQLTTLLKPVEDAKTAINDQKELISKLKAERSRQLSAAKSSETKEGAKPKAEKYVGTDEKIKKEEDKLRELNDKLFLEQDELNIKAHKGEINPRFYKKQENVITFNDPENRLKFRDVHESDMHRNIAAKAYYDSIMNLRPQDAIAHVFGKLTGSTAENPLKQRTLLIPDEILYNNNFMTKDLYAKTANYVNFLSRRTHLKTSFQDATLSGDFEDIATGLLGEYKDKRFAINNRIETLGKKLEDAKDAKTKAKIEKEMADAKKDLAKEKKEFESTKKTMKTLYETRMMGVNTRSDFDNMGRKILMSMTAATNLHNLPATQIGDLGFVGFQHGIWPFVRDGVYPLVNWMTTLGKGAESEALREVAPSLHLGLQDALNHYADRNWSMEMQPYFNMGKVVTGVQKFAHFSALTDLSPYIDNGVQHVAGSVIQSEFMRILHKAADKTMTEKESLYLRKYGIDPGKWADRIVKAYEESGGFKTKVGGHVSKFWEWQDLEASNEFSKAVFKGIQNTLIWKGMADSPFFADNMLGMFFHTFTGWAYAATNRYLIPSLQHADASLLLKFLWMGGAGALVSPTRRLARGEDAYPEDMDGSKIAYEAFTDSGVFSNISNVLNMTNFLSNDRLLGDLKNDKFRNRAKVGIFGMSDVVSSTAARVSNVLGMAANGDWNEQDLKSAAKMLPITGAMYAHYFSDKLIESWNLPRNRRAAEME